MTSSYSLPVNIIHVNSTAMNKLKYTYRSLFLLLFIVLMPMKGWGSDGCLVAEKANLYASISSGYKYACFYIESNEGKMNLSTMDMKSGSIDIPADEYPSWVGFRKDGSYVYFTKPDWGYPDESYLSLSITNTNGVDINKTKLILLLSNDPNLLTEKENLVGVTKMEFDLYTEDGLKSSAIQYGAKSSSFSSASSTSIIAKAATSTSVTLPDFNAKYLRWQLFDSETATTPITTIDNVIINSSSQIKGSDLIWFEGDYVAVDAARTVTFDFSTLAEGQNVENYVLKCTWANNDDNDAKVVTYNGTTYILQEPTLNGEYTFKFVKQETLDAIPLDLSSESVEATHIHEVNAIFKGQKLEISLGTVMPEILSAFEVADKSEVTDFYMRWVLADKDGKIISNASSSNGALALRATSSNDGYFTLLSSNGASLLPNGLNVSFELPAGSSWSADMQVYCLLTNNLEGYTAQYGVITKEPSAFKSKIKVNLFTPDDYPFLHYEGIANKKGDWKVVNGHNMQKTHVWEYYYYVDGKETNKQVLLALPFQWYSANGNNLEPRGYFRWYNYDTDKASTNLKVCDATKTLLKPKGNEGLFAFNLPSYATSALIGVNYSTAAIDDAWQGETIACDVSRYMDGLDESKSYLLHEPTLSIRYIFHILPRKKIADDIMAALCNHEDGMYTYEDNKKVTFGYKDEESVTTLRLQLDNVTRYSFYPMTAEGQKKLVYDDNVTEADFDTSNGYVSVPQYGGTMEWRVYDITKTKYCKLSSSTRFLNLSMKKLNDATTSWYDLDGNVLSSDARPTIGKGSPVYVVTYLNDGNNNVCPVANFDVRFMDFHPMTQAQIISAGLTNRTVSYLDEHYSMATKPISFDDDDEEQTLSAPTTPDDNQDRLPSKWDRRAYGFVYRDLIDYSLDYQTGMDHSPIHGEYGLYKSANISGISGNGNSGENGYVWWVNNTLRDRTYEMTKGSQSGHFLYVDASDESRQIAAADFKADLCTGMQMVFSAAVADMTQQQERPQVMFKLYGLDYDSNGMVKEQKLLHSFSSGDFKNNVEGLTQGVWYQVYGKIVLQKESGVENYSDFRVVIDNYCQNTLGADYAVDDIRIYVEPAKVQVLQDRPICGGSSTGAIKLKIRAIHETLNAITGHADNTKIYFRFMNEDGTPVEGTDEADPYYQTVQVNTEDATKNETYKSNKYGTVNVFDSEETCKKYTIDGVPMFETDSEGETYVVLSNRYYPLLIGKKYYITVSTEDPTTGKANWGNPSEVCSVYSDWFELISQTPYISDSNGNVITDYKVPCTGDYTINVKGNLTTVDSQNGGKVSLPGISYDWYLDVIDADHKLNVDACNEISISKDRITLGVEHKLYMKPSGSVNADGYMEYTVNGTIYLLCMEAIPVSLRVSKAGPQLNFGFNDVDYPFKDGDYEASLRIGLPQMKALKDKSGYLQVPLHSADYLNSSSDKTLSFVDDTKSDAAASSADVYVATTNDPLWKAKGATLLTAPVATLQSNSIGEIVSGTQSTLGLKFTDNALNNFHEGYWYELRFVFEQRTADATTTNCPGEAYLKLKIVPEFVTWRPTANGGMNANWNNDANWHRSSSAELYDDDYIDYQAYVSGESSRANAKAVEIPTIDNYVPMKFTKVTIDNLSGLPFPDLGNVVYRQSNGIATKLTNGKGNEASKYIQYDIMAYWDEAATNKGFDNNDLKCEKFYGNTCHQIYFKPQGELRDQCYLVYDKAWVEKELKPNTWYTMASPLQYIYAGDMYVPASNGRQETKAFTGINFSDTDAKDGSTAGKALYSRSLYPVYQRAWMKSDVKQVAADQEYDASHYPSGTAADNVEVNLGYWSHIYNKVDESYAADGTFGGFAIKAGNLLLPKDKTNNSLLRLPKEDTSYSYYEYDGKVLTTQTAVGKSAGHGKLLVAYNNSENHLAPMSQTLGSDNTSGFYLVANPYTCSLSLKKFFEANEGLQKAVWLVEESKVKSVSESDLADKDFAIQPMQSFFVKKVTSSDATTGDASSEVSEVKFTSQMYVDRTITAGLQMASDYIKNVNLTARDSKGNVSQARISLRPEASASYDEQEDVDLLCDENLMDIPQVYTVAGNEAVAVNAVPSIYWIPLGLVSDEAQEVTLSMQGLAKLDAPIYLYDAETASFTELHDDEPVAMMAGKYGRYFLTQNRTTTDIERVKAEAKKRMVKFYSTTAGRVVVTELGAEKHGEQPAYTLEGKKISVR